MKSRLSSWIMGLLNYEAQYRDFSGIGSLIDNCIDKGKDELTGTLDCVDGDFVFTMTLTNKNMKSCVEDKVVLAEALNGEYETND